MKKLLSCLLAAALATTLTVPLAGAAYTDVPAGGALAGEVQKAVDYGLMNGYTADTFGYSDSMTRAQFVTVLSRMMKWDSSGTGITDAMALPPSLSDTYYAAISAAVTHDAIDTNQAFRPGDAITRAEMSEMLVRALGLKSVAATAEKETPLPFSDVTDRAGYIAVAYAIGMTKGTSGTTFSPDATATRAQAAAMLVRIYEKLRQDTDFVHGFYAISSYSQLNFAQDMDAVSAGWSRMTWDGETALLSTTSANGNEFAIPSGYRDVTDYLEDHDVQLNLNVFMDGQDLKDMLTSADGRAQAVEQIVGELTVDYKAIGKNPYSGVTIDFEGLRSAQKADFTAFLKVLSREVKALDKSLYVCVPPYLTSGTFYDGYAWQAIGELADKVILMAYDYDPQNLDQFVGTEYYKTAATAPIGQVYAGLKLLTDVVDPAKVVLGFSCKNMAWQIGTDGKLLSGTPISVSSDVLSKRLAQPSTEFGWSDTYQQSYAIYTSETGERYFVWYQDVASVQASLRAAKLLGVSGVSLWRLGTLPMYSQWNWMSLLHS